LAAKSSACVLGVKCQKGYLGIFGACGLAHGLFAQSRYKTGYEKACNKDTKTAGAKGKYRQTPLKTLRGI
jgi:hypothetical protein